MLENQNRPHPTRGNPAHGTSHHLGCPQLDPEVGHEFVALDLTGQSVVVGHVC